MFNFHAVYLKEYKMAGWICKVWSIEAEDQVRYFACSEPEPRNAIIEVYKYLEATPDIRITAIKENAGELPSGVTVLEMSAGEFE